MVGDEDALHLGFHQFNLECIEPGSVFSLHKNVTLFLYDIYLLKKKDVFLYFIKGSFLLGGQRKKS